MCNNDLIMWCWLCNSYTWYWIRIWFVSPVTFWNFSHQERQIFDITLNWMLIEFTFLNNPVLYSHWKNIFIHVHSLFNQSGILNLLITYIYHNIYHNKSRQLVGHLTLTTSITSHPATHQCWRSEFGWTTKISHVSEFSLFVRPSQKWLSNTMSISTVYEQVFTFIMCIIIIAKMVLLCCICRS